MTLTNAYHFGVLVYDLEEAIGRFGELFGYTFNDPTVVHLNRLAEPGERSFDLRATYSRQGPPHLELIEAKGRGVYAAAHGEGLHHVGLWDPSIAANKKEFVERKGLEVEAEVLLPDDGTFAWYAKPSATNGVRFEFVDEAARPDLEKWIATGAMPGGAFVI
ncbi:VOC family protein [Streptomyces sp. NPDC047009]|uniref:VOC family protein n=1 Tax=Streptomyces sp. NPDC047009 TaxID=3154496 RepID=UPI00340B1AB5